MYSGIEAEDHELSMTEVNTDLWDHNKAVRSDGDSPF